MSKTKQNLAVDALAGEGKALFDYDGSNNLIYVGTAKTGSSSANAVWTIIKLVYTSGNLTEVLWADGDQKADNVWDNRISLDYS